MILHIIIDHRERKLKELFDQKKDKIQYESKQLDIADIVINNDVAIERKQGFDFRRRAGNSVSVRQQWRGFRGRTL